METFAWFGLWRPLKPQIGCNSNYRKKLNQDSNLTYIQVSGKDCFTKVVPNDDGHCSLVASSLVLGFLVVNWLNSKLKLKVGKLFFCWPITNSTFFFL